MHATLLSDIKFSCFWKSFIILAQYIVSHALSVISWFEYQKNSQEWIEIVMFNCIEVSSAGAK